MLTYRLLGRNGRLGNQLWQIASTIGIAHSRERRAVFPDWAYRRYFSVPDEYFGDPGQAQDLSPDWLQEVAYLSGVEDRIRQFFSLNPNTREEFEERHRSLLALSHKTAVHVRRGDYLEGINASLYVPVGMPYYEQAMATTSGPYLVFSDDIAWCRRQFPTGCIFIEGNADYEDLVLMASCDAVIGANSSFSWWGAWLSEGRRIFPRRWHLPAFLENPQYDAIRCERMMPVGAEILDS